VGQDGAGYELIWVNRERILFLQRGLDRVSADLPVRQTPMINRIQMPPDTAITPSTPRGHVKSEAFAIIS
jgi:hypothetical protein